MVKTAFVILVVLVALGVGYLIGHEAGSDNPTTVIRETTTKPAVYSKQALCRRFEIPASAC